MTELLSDYFSYRSFVGQEWSFFVLSRALAKTVTPDAPYIVISITDPASPQAELAESAHCRGVLRLSFNDVGAYRDDQILPEEDAQHLLAFARGQSPDVKTIVCHCEAGVSRSAAVAAALARVLGEDNEHFFANFAPNRWVYKTILDAAEEPIL